MKPLTLPFPHKGDIYVLSSLDREKKDHYILTALAKDNPGDVASNRRENSVQVSSISLVQGPEGLEWWRQQAEPLEKHCCRAGAKPRAPSETWQQE